MTSLIPSETPCKSSSTLPTPSGASNDGPVEPVLAHYDPRACSLLEDLAGRGERSLQGLAGLDGVSTPLPPREIADSWRDVNVRESP